jgi:hypothetical protein
MPLPLSPQDYEETPIKDVSAWYTQQNINLEVLHKSQRLPQLLDNRLILNINHIGLASSTTQRGLR